MKMSGFIVDEKERQWQKRDREIRVYLSRFETQLEPHFMETDPMLHYRRSKNFVMIERVKNPKYDSIEYIDPCLGVFGMEFLVTFRKSQDILDHDTLTLVEARKVAPHLCAFYANVKKWPVIYRAWEWAADEKWCPLAPPIPNFRLITGVYDEDIPDEREIIKVEQV